MSNVRTGIKMRVTPEQNRKVQEICFENGIDWSFGGKQIRHDTEPYLFVENTISFMYEVEEEDFLNDLNEEVSAELFIRTNGTCVNSVISTENNNKGEEMEELKLECLVEGYEGTYFEIGQVWETREGYKLKIKEFDLKADGYKIIMVSDDLIGNYYYTLQGKKIQGFESDLDLVRLISTESTPTKATFSEEPQPKTLSEYLKENNAYESFVENCVGAFLKDLAWYKVFKSENKIISLGNIFIFEDTKEGQEYWCNLSKEQPENLVDDMNEIIFAEVDKRIAEYNPSTKYMVFVEGRKAPKVVHDSYDSAEKEAKRLSAKEIGCNVFVVEIIKAFKSRVIVEEV